MGLTQALAVEGGPKSVFDTNTAVWPSLHSDTVAFVKKYLDKGKAISIADGSGVVAELENELANWLQLPYVLTTNSGTNAIFSAFTALNLPAGSEVIAPVFGFHASITPALWARLTPVLVDVDPWTGNITVDSIRAAMSDRTLSVVI